MKKQFKEVSLELYEDNLGKFHIRLDNILNNQYINVLRTSDKVQALILFQDLYDVLNKHQEN